LAFEVTFAQHIHQRTNNIVGDESLNLDGIAGSNVGHGPGSLLDDVHLSMNEQLGQQRAGTSSQDGIGLNVTSCNDIPDCSQSGGNHGHLNVVQQSDQPRDDTGVDNLLNPFVRAIGEVRQGPASVSEDLFVVVVDQVGQCGKQLPDGRDTGRRILVTTQVGQSPSDITQECSLKIKSINICTQK
jgi:hypothetical protein